MKKILNDPKHVVDEMLQGLCLTHNELVDRVDGTGVIYRKFTDEGKVGLVSGGGSGHEPAHAGFVGKGMLSAAACGEVFTSPTPDQILEAIKKADQGAGGLLIVKNYSGDIMNFEMAMELADMEDIPVKHVVVNDDIALEDTQSADRRGVAGTLFVHKILGAAAEIGTALEDLQKIGNDVVANMASLGVALTPATVPEVGKPGFELADNELEYGIGIHGESGYRRENIKSSKAIAEELVSQLKNELNWTQGDRFGC
ncbi:Phosphoenolpyruvate--glycerone phosphotransferase [Lentibacillus sp. JNUCC-1]|nr:Phosphoenolpyruvate--glycerone phosphotransferase [Lentibacillus sp. JNUCC-1]